MGTAPGYPAGYFKYVLAIDCETTGLKFNADDPSEGHQSVSWGIIVANADTLEPIKKLYVEIKWNDESVAARQRDPKFGKRAEEIHGLTFEYLEDNGMSEREAVEEIGGLILEYFADGNIRTLGHNVATFDLWFLKRLFRKFQIELKFGSRHIDTSSLGYVNFGVYTSDQLFDAVGFDARDAHNALEDAEMSLESARRMRMIFETGLNNL